MVMKTAISIPDNVFRTADRFARRKKLSRSAVFTKAVAEFLAHHRQEDVTEQLNAVYGKMNSSLDSVVHGLQFTSISREKW